MGNYILRRLLLMIPTLIGLSILVFLLTRFTPGDVVDRLTGDIGYQNPELKAQLRQQFGLTNSLPHQYLTWMGHVLTGNFGQSYFSGIPVTQELKNRVPVSVELGVLGLGVSILLGLPIGIISAVYQDKWPDYLTRGAAIALLAIPSFVLAVSVLLLGAKWFHWAPPAIYAKPWQNLGTNLYIMLTPVLILGLGLSGGTMRLMRTQMLEVMRQDYIRTARAKGLTEVSVLIRHAAKNALIPVVTVIGLQIPIVVAGTVVLESIFLLPGVGRYLLDSASRNDYPVIQGLTLIVAVVIVFTNLLVDLSYALLDPRVRYG